MAEDDGFTEGQLKSLALIPKFTSFLSLVAQTWIVAEVSYSKKKRISVYHRLLAGMSVASMFRSFSFFLSTWPIPRSYPEAYGNVGTRTTCQIQGFMIQFGLVSPVYMTIISMYYWLTIRYGWTEQRVKYKERILHGVPWLVGIATAVTALLLDLYHPAGFYCWIASSDQGEDNLPDFYRLALYYGPVIFCFLLFLFFLGSLYLGIRAEEIRTLKYRQPHLFMVSSEMSCVSEESAEESMRISRRSVVRRLSRIGASIKRQSNRPSLDQISRNHPSIRLLSLQVSSQVVCYVVSFCAAHCTGALYRLLESFGIDSYGLLLAMSIMDPLQGFFDFCVYRRPIFIRLQRNNPEENLLFLIGRTLQWPGVEGKKKERRPNLMSALTTPFPSNIVEASKESEHDPLGALTDDVDTEKGNDEADNVQPDDRLEQVKQLQMRPGIAPKTATRSRGGLFVPNRNNASSRGISLPKIVEDMEMDVDIDDDINEMREEREVGVCLGRDAQLELLADLDIIEEVDNWVSYDVKRKLHRQMSLPVISSNYKVPDPFGRKVCLVTHPDDEEVDSDDDDFCPALPSLSYHQTV